MANGWLRATSQALVLKRSLAGVSLELRAVGLEKPTALADWLLTEDDCAAEEAPISPRSRELWTAVMSVPA